MQQTKITPNIEKIAESFTGRDINTIKQIIIWIKKNIKSDDKIAKKRSRTANKIIESKIATGCIDIALIFISLSRARGFETLFIEAIEKDWLESKESKNIIKGHIFCRIKINNKSFIVNPTEGTISEKEVYLNKNKEYAPIKEGKDSWDIGFFNNKDLAEFLKENE